MRATGSSLSSAIWLLLSLIVLPAAAVLNNLTSPTHSFRSRPDIHAPILDILISRPELMSPGYLFLAPYRNLAPGPYIYDSYGELVYSGAGAAGPRTAHLPHVCQYKGEDHLCFYQGEQHHGYARGYGVIMDTSYRTIKVIESAGGGISADMHEFRLTPYSNGKTALMTLYQTRFYDLLVNPKFNMKEGAGWVIDGMFQEVDVETGELLFEWRSLDHIDPSVSIVAPGSTDTSGSGLSAQTGWDYFHINSVDKNQAGDYLVSSRHTCAIYKVSGEDGHIIWQLGGTLSTIESVDFAFGYQHDARWLSENATHTVLTFFDNSGNGFNFTNPHSHGVIVAIDHTQNKAHLVQAQGAPEPSGGLKSASQGSVQILPNGGQFICWGEHSKWSEHAPDGSTVLYGQVAVYGSGVMLYRAFKLPWIGTPITKPALHAFSRSGDATSGTHFFVSWNGATEVREWRFFSAETAKGEWTLAGSAVKDGFETEFVLPDYHVWVYAEALDEHGVVLSTSAVEKTFVPSPALIPYCDYRGCENNWKIGENDTRTPYNSKLDTEEEYLSTERGYDTAHYYRRLSEATTIYRAVLGKVDHSFSAVLLAAVTMVGVAAVGWYYRRARWLAVPGKIWELLKATTSNMFACSHKGRYDAVQHKPGIEMYSSSSSEAL